MASSFADPSEKFPYSIKKAGTVPETVLAWTHIIGFQNMRSFFPLVFLAAGTLLPVAASADIYSYTGEDGAVHFTNVPTDKRFRVVLRTPREASGGESDNSAYASRAGRAPQSFRNYKTYGAIIDSAAESAQIENALVHAVISAESGYNQNAVSPKGATGLMQLMPATARRYGVTNIYDPVQNIQAGARYLRDLMGMFNNDLRLAIAAYNAGENAVIRHGNRIPPYRETMNYVPKVMGYYSQFKTTSQQ